MLYTKPEVSVLMAAYNAEKYVASAIQSILAQDFKNFELIFVDDASSDGTLLIANSLARTDSRIKIILNDANLGLVKSLNKGLSVCSSDIIARADADDLAMPYRIDLQLKYMKQHPDVGVIGGMVEFIDKDDKPLERKLKFFPSTFDEIKVHSLLGCQLWHTTVMFQKSLVIENGGYSEDLHGGPEDYELWARLFKSSNFYNIPSTLAFQRIHSSSITAQWSKGFQMFCEVARNLQTAYLGRTVTPDEARGIVSLCGCEGKLTEIDVQKTLLFLDEILKTVKRRESAKVYSFFFRKCLAALERQAMNATYTSPALSRLLALYILRKSPTPHNSTVAALALIKPLVPSSIKLLGSLALDRVNRKSEKK